MKCKSGSLAERARVRGNVPRAGACREYSTNVWIVVGTINQQYPYCSTTRSTSSGSTPRTTTRRTPACPVPGHVRRSNREWNVPGPGATCPEPGHAGSTVLMYG